MSDTNAPTRVGLLKLLELAHGNQYVIPVYQREYTWEANKEVKQYLIDLEKIIYGDYKNHFLGIIIQLDTSKGIGKVESSVVDGQQRITTTFLIMYAIKYLLNKQGDSSSAKLIENKYLINDVNVYGFDRKYRLKPMVSDDDVYKQIVENKFDSITNKESKIYKNFIYIVECLENICNKGISVEQILDAMNKLYVVSIPITESDNPQRIFESINATGEKLTAADLMKNYLLMNLDNATQENYYFKYWKKLEEFVSNDSKQLESFFRFYLAIKQYVLIAKNNVYREFVSWYESNKTDVKTIFEDLNNYAKYYYDLQFKDLNSFDKNFKPILNDYRKINSDLTLPLTLEFYSLYENKKIDVDTLTSLIEVINIYMIRRSICDINSQNISRLFPSILKKINEICSSGYDKIVDILKQELIAKNVNTSGSYMPNDKQMMELLYNANVYGRPSLRIILDRLELNNNPAPVDLSALSIEHLMPQTPTDDWPVELNTDIDTYNENLHRLGNLTLAAKPDNSKMKNLSWEYKNKILQSTNHLTLNKNLLKIEKWDIDCINKRTKELILKVCDLYPYPDLDSLNSEDDGVDVETSLNIALNTINKNKLICLRKNKLYYSNNNEEGYFISHSKKYKQKDKNLYWFAFRENSFDGLTQTINKYYVFICRGDVVKTVKIPLKFLKDNCCNFDFSLDSEGSITHYHIKICIYPDGLISLQLPKSSMREIDIAEYVL